MKLLYIAAFVLFFVSIGVIPVSAKTIYQAKDIVIEKDGTMKTIENRTVEANSTYYEIFAIPQLALHFRQKNLPQLLVMEKNSIHVFLNDKEILPKITSSSDSYQVRVAVQSSDRTKIRFEFTNYQSIQTIGLIKNYYIYPQMFGSTYDNEYLKIDKLINDASVLNLESDPRYDSAYVNYLVPSSVFSKKKFIWLQIGSKQIWSFDLLENVSTRSSNDVSSKYEIIIPRDDKYVYQKIYFESFSIPPTDIRTSLNGNLIATFIVPSSVSTIEIRGYAIVEKANNQDMFVIYLSDEDRTKFISEQKYWEVNDPQITAAVNKLPHSSVEAKEIENTYNFVVQNVNYDTLKLGIDNYRQGAVATLKKGSGVCMEYSDLLITLLRAQHIPSRAVFGAAYDPNRDVSEPHQWAQAYTDGTGWFSIDPTWGSSVRSYIGADYDHFTWYYSETNVEDPPSISRLTSLPTDTPLSLPIINITPFMNNVDLSGFLTTKDAMIKYSSNALSLFINELPVRINQVSIGNYLPIFILMWVVFIFIYMSAKLFLARTAYRPF